MKKIRIAFIIDELNLGGTEKQLVSLIQRLNHDKFEAYLVCLRNSEWLRTIDLNCQKIVLEVKKLLSYEGLKSLVWLSRFFRRHKIDILQTYLIDACIFGVVAGILGGIPVIVSSRRDMGFWYTPKLLLVFKILDYWVDHYMVNSKTVRDNVLKNEKVNSHKIAIFYNGIDLEPFRRINDSLSLETRKKMGISNEDFVVGVVSNLNRPIKRVDIFLRAAGEVRKKHKNSIFLIIGDGCLKSELVKLSSVLGIKKRTFFLGLQKDVIPYLGIMNIAVLTSDSEGFSNAILEYMAAGIPVVATDCGGTGELIDNGSTGILVPPGDYGEIANAICSLLSDRERRINMGKAAKRIVQEKYAWDAKIKELEDYCLSIVGNR